MKTIFIGGASGFIGKNLVEYFKGKYRLLASTHQELDLTDEGAVSSYFSSHKIDIVINGTVIGGSRKEEEVQDGLPKNLRIFFNLVRNQKYFEKLIHFGSGAEYDKRRPIVKIREEDFDKRVPSDDYGFFKYICAKYIENVKKIVNLRLFGVYGKYEDYRYRFISYAILRNLFRLPIIIRQNVYFDYLYIDDLVKIVDFFINNNTKFNTYNVAKGEVINLLSITKIIEKISGFKSKNIIKFPGLNNEYSASNNRLKKELPDDLRFTPHRVGIKKLFDYYQKHLVEIDRSEISDKF